MTRAELILATRYYLNTISTDAGAFFDDAGNMLECINSALEDVVMDLIPIMPEIFRTSELLSLTAATANVALATSNILWIEKIALNKTNERGKEIEILEPSEIPFHEYTGETIAEPTKCYIRGNSVYFVPTPSTTTASYAKVWEVVGEATPMAAGGPTLIPTYAQRLIALMAAHIGGSMQKWDTSMFLKLYAMKLQRVKDIFYRRYQSKTRFLKESVRERHSLDQRDRAFYDEDSPID